MAILQGFIKTIKRRLTNEGYKWQSEKTSSQTVVMGDGTDNTDTAEKRFGAIKGLTSSTSVTDTGYALDATIGKKHEDSIATLNQSLSSIVFIKSVKIYAATTIAAGQGANIYFSVPTVKNYKCILGIGGTSSNGYAIPVRASDTPRSDGTLRLYYKNISSETTTVNDLYCNMIFVRN